MTNAQLLNEAYNIGFENGKNDDQKPFAACKKAMDLMSSNESTKKVSGFAVKFIKSYNKGMREGYELVMRELFPEMY
jgi:phage regulator Rha-like protein